MCTKIFTDTYLKKVLSVPGRSFERAQEKLLKSFEIREDYGVDRLDSVTFQDQLDQNAIYWKGRTSDGRPILWAEPGKRMMKDFDVDKEFDMHVYLIELALKEHLTSGVDEFVIVCAADQTTMAHYSLQMMKLLKKIATIGPLAYPDRIHCIYLKNASYPTKLLLKAVRGFLPVPVQAKIKAVDAADMHNLHTHELQRSITI